MTILQQGSQVAVVGGGPAGSFAALHLLKFSHAAGLDLDLTVYEPSSFTDPGAAGCNMCAGILSPSLMPGLQQLELGLPEEVIVQRVTSYRLHSAHGTLESSGPPRQQPILCVHRGCGPVREAGQMGFDRFLLEQVERRGGQVEHSVVRDVDFGGPRPSLLTAKGRRQVDLLVVATGVNAALTRELPPPFHAPSTERMAQVEVMLGREAVTDLLGDRVHVVLLPGERLRVATLVPKGDHVNVSLLGAGPQPMTMADFLEHPTIRRWLPSGPSAACRCRPRISVGAASQPYTERVVVVGDAAVCRLYKDGMGSAFRTAERAAHTAIVHGVGAGDFARHYRPLIREIATDNLYGRLLFSLHRWTKDSRGFFRIQAAQLRRERSRQGGAGRLDRINWGMFTGARSYRAILGALCAPRLWIGMLGSALDRGRGRRQSRKDG